MNNEREKAFTLIEPMVVIAIIGILGVVITPVVTNAIAKAEAAKLISDFQGIESGSNIFYADVGQYPVNVNGSTYTLIGTNMANLYGFGYSYPDHSLLVDPGAAGWDGPYFNKPARSRTEIRIISPGCHGVGHYYTQWHGGDWSPTPTGTYYGDFDLDEDGTNETTNGWSVSVYPVPTNIQRIANKVIDNNNSGLPDSTGRLKLDSGCDVLTYYLGQIN
jgi:prepilin-type N-terminal cleavage/methylation domain-containing protein